jgi:GNAT superfamily N-acetyltransferase
MPTTYYRRFRMEVDFRQVTLSKATLPDGYRWVPWQPVILERHAIVKWHSFTREIDSKVFPCLGQLDGCRRLMHEITRQESFVAGTTWMIAFHPHSDWPVVDCGTIQGIAHNRRVGAIQNVGVVPEHRGSGLGRALVLQSLHGFRSAGLKRVYLEVTADNNSAVELYRTVGFQLVRTMYRAVEIPEMVSA